MKRESNMAEGGYDPETTNPFDPHGDDHDDGDDDENIPLLPFSKEKPPSHKYPTQNTSTSAHHNPSFITDHTASDRLHTMEVFHDIGIEQIKEIFPNSDTSKYLTKMDDDGTIYVKIKEKDVTKRTNYIWHPIIDKDGEVIMGEGRKKFPKTLRDALGKDISEIVKDGVAKNKKIRRNNKRITRAKGKCLSRGS